jgi:hypothetical protein
MRILQRNLKRATDTFLFISHTPNVLLFKSRCNIFIGFRIIKEMPGPVSSGTPFTIQFRNTALPFTGQETIGSKRQSDLLTMGVNTPETC